MMNMQIMSAGIAISSVTMYMFFLKLIPEKLDPLMLLLTFYVTAVCCTVVAICLLPASDLQRWSTTNFSWPAIGAGMSIVGIELGYLLMYRNGWHLSGAPLVVMGGAALLLTPIGILMFKQPWTIKYIFGIALCVFALYLLAPSET